MNNTPKRNILRELSTIGLSDIVGMGLVAVFWFFIAAQVEVEEYGELHYFIAIASFAFNVLTKSPIYASLIGVIFDTIFKYIVSKTWIWKSN